MSEDEGPKLLGQPYEVKLHTICVMSVLEPGEGKIIFILFGKLKDTKPAALSHQEVILDVACPPGIMLWSAIKWFEGI